MVFVMVRHRVKDVDNWKVGFDAAVRFRRWGGERVYYLFQRDEDPNEVIALFEWDTLRHARAFFTSDEIRQAMEKAGVEGNPEILYLHDIGWSRLE